jgi:asparagine synthase (glutamine-hydrolysing)
MVDDEIWARRAAGELPSLHHQVLPGRDIPTVYADLPAASEMLDEPSIGVASRARVKAVIAAGAQCGAQLHLTGHGGDNLFVGLPTVYRDILLRRPALSWPRLNAYRHMFGWSLGAMIGQLVRHRTYAHWLRDSVTEGTQPSIRTPLLSWGVAPSIPPWVTPYGVGLIKAEFGRAAAHAQPLASTRGRHFELEAILDGARLVRALMVISAETGPLLGAPFYDDRVIEAALAIRVEDRVTPWFYKPALRQAMSGIVPQSLLDRDTKGVGSADVASGLRDHRADLLDLWADSRMAALGLVDSAALAALCRSPDSPELADGSILTTVACEVWLRALERSGR